MTAAPKETQPVITVDVASPTEDKPQSKLWFAHEHWWCWLPTREGSGIWKRTASGWVRQTALDAALRNLPGRADVVSDGDRVWAAVVGKEKLAVVELQYQSAQRTYTLSATSPVWALPPGTPQAKSTESATISRDRTGRLWVAYDHREQIVVRSCLEAVAGAWSEPVVLGTCDADDIACMVTLSDSVGVIWSDQKTMTVRFRRHLNGRPINSWEAVERVDEGKKTADDHLNAAVTLDDTLYVATKNSVDTIGQHQLVLRIRDKQGRWTNHGYAHRTATEEPSRPIVVVATNPNRLSLAYTTYRRGNDRGEPSFISGFVTNLAEPNLNTPAKPLLATTSSLNNVTCCKSSVTIPVGTPWILLASDAKGQVFEAIIP